MQELSFRKSNQGRLGDLYGSKKKALLIGTHLKVSRDKSSFLEHLEELESLSHTYGIETVFKLVCPLRKINTGTYLGSGKVEEIRLMIAQKELDLVIFDDEISPQQQRNLEKIFEVVVIDRTELILEVFAQRAQTKEAKIQIELAFYRYQLPRLRRLWTHLHRQRSGGSRGGAIKGEGEKQIEIDRQIIRRQIERLQKQLEVVKKQRNTQRKLKERSRIPIFAIIGYTNVGKSTLLRALTDAEVFIEDKLFATLDPTTRKYLLTSNQAILLTDTVGFIRKIPHQLVAAFKSTLEEVFHADILLHLIDASSSYAFSQAQSTKEVLKELGAENHPMIHVANKIDAVQDPLVFQKMRIQFPKLVLLSALKQLGFEELQDRMVETISHLYKLVFLRIPQSHYALVSEILKLGKIISCEYEENDILIEAKIPHQLERKVFHFVSSH